MIIRNQRVGSATVRRVGDRNTPVDSCSAMLNPCVKHQTTLALLHPDSRFRRWFVLSLRVLRHVPSAATRRRPTCGNAPLTLARPPLSPCSVSPVLAHKHTNPHDSAVIPSSRACSLALWPAAGFTPAVTVLFCKYESCFVSQPDTVQCSRRRRIVSYSGSGLSRLSTFTIYGVGARSWLLFYSVQFILSSTSIYIAFNSLLAFRICVGLSFHVQLSLITSTHFASLMFSISGCCNSSTARGE